ncbi:hypothetical protein PFICI_07905 [Pestalotiopsis fici W106-1]|uniref:RING-type domain-containing protein n=1 Tax=Pestalotiopsis fici (strain W106-1 / CGMCC3.15140) TaxID=1229662 RepID=W3X5B1_PESFW|nr:uncharacterized protein PFICI_07905 [Pestalotiopsis fici W106-1]ETS80376.1 hypothetical protein PFICI_07905 [Pestalotiopsis fici W106-1]
MARSSKARSKPTKATQTVVKSETDQPFPLEFLELISSSSDDLSEGSHTSQDEPPQKRSRWEGQQAVTVAKSSLSLKRRRHAALQPSLATFQRHRIERFIKFQADIAPEGAENVLEALVLSTMPTSRHGRYKIELETENIGVLSPNLIKILDIGNRSRDNPADDGAVYVSVDVTFDELDDGHHLDLDFSLKWNECNDIYKGLRTPQQRRITDDIQKTFFASDTDVGSHIGVQSSQAFYEAACITDESYTDLNSFVIPGLTSSLYPFQRRALQWLLAREGVRWAPTGNNGLHGLTPTSPQHEHKLPISFHNIQDANGDLLYHSALYHVVTRDVRPWQDLEYIIKGGILAEEMGLGKTVEAISLILLHRRPLVPGIIRDAYTDQEVCPTGATLIVTPETLKKQWISEIKSHAPALRVMVYDGLFKHQETVEELKKQMIESDVVVTTYSSLRAEIHLTRPEPERSRRHERKRARATSPLVKLSWWRVCLDEAQQIESGVSAAAEVARLIPRVNAWGITGTPVKEKIQDLWGLLRFLRYEPFASYPATWDTLISRHRDYFTQLFNRLALRHTKHAVRSELVLPPQRRYVITMPFTAVEEQNYRSRFKREAESLGLYENGVPIVPADWDANKPSTIDQMRRALATLRQTVLHPQLGPERARALGGSISKALKTIDEVLDAMIEQTDSVIKQWQRSYLLAKLRRGQLLENSPRVPEALAIWSEALLEIEALEIECRSQMMSELENAGITTEDEQRVINDEGDFEDGSDQQNILPRLGEARRRLRSALDLKHRAVFFIASAYFQIKSNEKMTDPNSDEFGRLEKLEADGYKNANLIRQEILQETNTKAALYMTELSKKAKKQSFVDIPEFKSSIRGGLETRRHVDQYEELIEVLNEQANMVDQLREHVIQLLLRPLVDREEEEITGEEYEDSTKIQNDLMVYTTILRAAISDRQEALSGLVNERTKHELASYKRQATQGEGPSPETFLGLLKLRDESRPKDLQGSLRGLISDLRELATKLHGDNSERSQTELRIVRDLQKLVQEDTVKQTKANANLEKELGFFTSAMNARVEYYRQLQALSDTVATWDREDLEKDDIRMRDLLNEEARCQRKIQDEVAAQRYQVHLKDQGQTSEKKICPVCTDPYTVGILTPCTHEFCEECIATWVAAHHRCPLCKKPVSMRDCHKIIAREPKLKLRQDQESAILNDPHSPESQHQSRTQGIYTSFGEDKLKEINDIPLDGHVMPTKVTALIRHLLFLRKTDPGAKSIIFSQFGAFLDILRQALNRHHIGNLSFSTKNGITRFKEDPAIECFLMDARAHASGLNLVNANHVFLCEPLLNTALELQAIARVDRIGQTHETNVWLYLVEGTVEESIYNLSTKRRLEHMATTRKGKETESSVPTISEDNLEVANSMELQQANLPKLMDKDTRLGEVVDQNDLWTCLFGHVTGDEDAEQNAMSSDARFETQAVRGFLAGRAAQERAETQTRYHEEREMRGGSEAVFDEGSTEEESELDI